MSTATPGMQLFDTLTWGDSVNVQSVNAANKRVAGLYVAPKAGTLTYVGFQVNGFTASGDVDVRLEGITSSGLPDGTLVAAGASAAPTISAAGWTWQALGTPPTVSAGQLLSGVVSFKTSSTLNATFGYNLTNTRVPNGPYACQDNGTGTWSIAANPPAVCLKYSDGTIILGGCPLLTLATAAYASSTNPNERASVFTAPFDCEIVGARVMMYPTSRTTSDWQVNLYSGTGTTVMTGGTAEGDPALSSSIFAPRMVTVMFPAPVALTAGTTYRLALKATNSGTVNLPRLTWNSTAERDAAVGPCWSDTRNGGAWIGASTTTTEFIVPLLSSYTAPAGGGTYTDPGVANVRSGTGYTYNSVALTGTCAVPSAANTLSGVSVDAGTGTYVTVATGSVKTGVTYGAASALTGTYDGSDRWTDPGVTNVRLSTAYKANSTTNNRTGTLTLPAITDVASGVTYGAGGTEFTGTLSGGGMTLSQLQTELNTRGATAGFFAGTAGGVNVVNVGGQAATLDPDLTAEGIATQVELQIMDDTDTRAVLQALVDKIAAANPSLGGLTLSAIAQAVRDVDNASPAAGSLGAAAKSASGNTVTLIASLGSVPTAADNAAAVWANGARTLTAFGFSVTVSGTPNVNVAKVNGVTVGGAGTTGSPWGPA